MLVHVNSAELYIRKEGLTSLSSIDTDSSQFNFHHTCKKGEKILKSEEGVELNLSIQGLDKSLVIDGIDCYWQIRPTADSPVVNPKGLSSVKPIPEDPGYFISPETGRRVDRRYKSSQRQKLCLWIRVPNLLLPIHFGKSNQRNPDLDGNYSIVHIVLGIESGSLVLERLGLAAGTDTSNASSIKSERNWIKKGWITDTQKKVHRSVTRSRIEDALQRPLKFAGHPVQSGLRFGSPARFRLEASCEALLGIRSLDQVFEDKKWNNEVSLTAPLKAYWRFLDSSWRLQFERRFIAMPVAVKPLMKAGEKILLTQRSREGKLVEGLNLQGRRYWDLVAWVPNGDLTARWWNDRVSNHLSRQEERSLIFEMQPSQMHSVLPVNHFTFSLFLPQISSVSPRSNGFIKKLSSIKVGMDTHRGFALAAEMGTLIGKNVFSYDNDSNKSLEYTLRFPRLLTHQNLSASLQARVVRTFSETDLSLKMELKPGSLKGADPQLTRWGAMDLWLGGNLLELRDASSNTVESPLVHVRLIQNKKKLAPGEVFIWEAVEYQIGGTRIDSSKPGLIPKVHLLQWPVLEARPGGVDLDSRATPDTINHSAIILPSRPPDFETNGREKYLIAIGQRIGGDGDAGTRISLRKPHATALNKSKSGQFESVFYLSWRPFLFAMVRTNLLKDFDTTVGDGELAYWSSQGLFWGWQGRAAAERLDFILPPQGLGEAMERYKTGTGFSDINPDELVDFRMTPPTVLRLEMDNQPRAYASMIWNLGSLLDRISENRLTGLPLKEADLELLYGMGFHISDRPGLRVAELFSRLGWPRPELEASALTQVGERVRQRVRDDWSQTRERFFGRLAVYELYDEFVPDSNGNSLKLYGDREKKRGVSAFLRRGADFVPSVGKKDSKTTLQPRYAGDQGLHGSLAWAFESRNIWRAVWEHDPDDDTKFFVEALEATLARLYFSALGGWGSQEARFDNGRTIIAANVEMGRVSELRIERIGRIGCVWNKAKHVIVYRRSTLPSRQFALNQDRHPGRPILRKAEEWVEFMETHRRFPDGQTLEATDSEGTPGALSGCSCHERILVDSRWGEDVDDNRGNPSGWKIPLRKPGAREDIYGPANVLLHFHADSRSGEKETSTRITNLERVWFWTDVTPEKTSDTEAWGPVPDIDLARFHKAKESDSEVQSAQKMSWGSPLVTTGAAPFTWLVAPMDAEVNVVNHLPLKGDEASRPRIGSRIRAVTMSRDDLKLSPDVPEVGALGVGPGLAEVIENRLATFNQVRDEARRAYNRIKDNKQDALDAMVKELHELLFIHPSTPIFEAFKGNYQIQKVLEDLGKVRGLKILEDLEEGVSWGMQRSIARLEGLGQDWVDGFILKLNEFNTPQTLPWKDILHKIKVDPNIVNLGNQLKRVILPVAAVEALDGLKNIKDTIQKAHNAAEDLKKQLEASNFPLDVNHFKDIEKAVEALQSRYAQDVEDLPIWNGDFSLGIERLRDRMESLVRDFEHVKWEDVLKKPAGDALKARAVDWFNSIRMDCSGFEKRWDEIEKSLKKLKSEYSPFVDIFKEMEKYPGQVSAAILQAKTRLMNLRDNMANQFKNETQNILNALPKVSDLTDHFLDPVSDFKSVFDQFDQKHVNALLKPLEERDFDAFEQGAKAWALDAQKRLNVAEASVNRLLPTTKAKIKNLKARGNQVKQELSRLLKGAEAAAEGFEKILNGGAQDAGLRLHRLFGEVPKVPGMDFQGIAGELKALAGGGSLVKQQAKALLRGGVQTVGFAIQRAEVLMTPVEAITDRARDLLNESANEVKLKASSLVLPVRTLRDRLEADFDETVEAGKKKLGELFPDFGGLRLEKLLGPLPLSDDFKKQVQQKVKLSHGFDRQSRTAHVEARVDDLSLGRDITLFSFGPFACRLARANLYAYQRVSSTLNGETEKKDEGRLTGDWELRFSGQPLVTFRRATLECINGSIRMDLDPSRLEMSQLLQSISDLCSAYSGEDGFVCGVETKLPNSVRAHCRLNLELPPVESGTFAISNLWLGAFFGLSVVNENGVSGFTIEAALNLSSREKPFALIIFILGGSGWFKLGARYFVPFKEGKPRLAVDLDVGMGAAAGLGINLGFLRGSVMVSLALNMRASIDTQSKRKYLSFAIVLSFAGHVSVLGIISIDLSILLAVRYETGGGLVGEGRVQLRIKICWCFKIEIDRSFQYRFGGAGGRRMAASNRQDHHRYMASIAADEMDWDTELKRERMAAHLVC